MVNVSPRAVAAEPSVAVIGGSGFYELLAEPTEVDVDTPFGRPSGAITLGQIGGRQVAFLPRHGPQHHLPPDRVNYRANLWALRELGVTRVIGSCAVGSLHPDVHPGDFVVLDQLVDRTHGRPDTFLDGTTLPGADHKAPAVEHVSFADPYCPELSAALTETGEGRMRSGGTVVVIPGPRFATRAESADYRARGWEVINMTQYPEAYLARELGLCYAGLALVTDYDTGALDDPTIEPVTMQRVLAVLADNVNRARDLLGAAIPLIPEEPQCRCAVSGAEQLRP
jgi:5'-methylthioadenosine phosphorylase